MAKEKKYIKKEKIGFLDFNHARTPKQIELMRKIAEDGVCPFCPEYFTKYHPKPILKETKWWYATENMNPYEGTRVSLIFVYKKHTTLPSEISSEGAKQLFELIGWAEKEFQIEGGSFFIRFGKTEYTGGSVEHFHAQLIVGNAKGTDAEYEKLKVKLGYKNLNKPYLK
jgi:diadenosine tetraphosphate (Ap4A) HIT family hydrolase